MRLKIHKGVGGREAVEKKKKKLLEAVLCEERAHPLLRRNRLLHGLAGRQRVFFWQNVASRSKSDFP
jgi:hypothetical protein